MRGFPASVQPVKLDRLSSALLSPAVETHIRFVESGSAQISLPSLDSGLRRNDGRAVPTNLGQTIYSGELLGQAAGVVGFAGDSAFASPLSTWSPLILDKVQAIKRFVDLEALIWTVGLIVVAAGSPTSETHFTLFWPQWVFGIESPGRGLGHSIGYLFRGDVQASLQTHWLGLPVVAILAHRIVILQWRKWKSVEIREISNG